MRENKYWKFWGKCCSVRMTRLTRRAWMLCLERLCVDSVCRGWEILQVGRTPYHVPFRSQSERLNRYEVYLKEIKKSRFAHYCPPPRHRPPFAKKQEPYFGERGGKARFCATHKPDDSMVDVRHRRWVFVFFWPVLSVFFPPPSIFVFFPFVCNFSTFFSFQFFFIFFVLPVLPVLSSFTSPPPPPSLVLENKTSCGTNHRFQCHLEAERCHGWRWSPPVIVFSSGFAIFAIFAILDRFLPFFPKRFFLPFSPVFVPGDEFFFFFSVLIICFPVVRFFFPQQPRGYESLRLPCSVYYYGGA